MKSPRQVLLVSGLGILLIGGMILFGSDGASTSVRMLQYLFLGLGVVAFVAALFQMRR